MRSLFRRPRTLKLRSGSPPSMSCVSHEHERGASRSLSSRGIGGIADPRAPATQCGSTAAVARKPTSSAKRIRRCKCCRRFPGACENVTSGKSTYRLQGLVSPSHGAQKRTRTLLKPLSCSLEFPNLFGFSETTPPPVCIVRLYRPLNAGHTSPFETCHEVFQPNTP